jgi:hypothetical protein
MNRTLKFQSLYIFTKVTEKGTISEENLKYYQGRISQTQARIG